ncbi:MAG: nucleotidyltransferase [Pedobacter sp.]|nr:MAG: nucleotidyltransferase [Pedobacter sp.]
MEQAVQNKATLLSRLQANGSKLRSYGVLNLRLFGSFLTGHTHAESDIDLLVEFHPHQKNYDNFIDLSFFLEELLGRKVEVITEQSLNKYIGPHILSNAEYVSF